MRAAGLALSLLAAGSARGSFVGLDHFERDTVTDSAGTAKHTVDLAAGEFGPPFTDDAGCTVKLPATMVCNPVVKTNVVPRPPNDAVGFGPEPAHGFACYGLKCPEEAGVRRRPARPVRGACRRDGEGAEPPLHAHGVLRRQLIDGGRPRDDRQSVAWVTFHVMSPFRSGATTAFSQRPSAKRCRRSSCWSSAAT